MLRSVRLANTELKSRLTFSQAPLVGTMKVNLLSGASCCSRELRRVATVRLQEWEVRGSEASFSARVRCGTPSTLQHPPPAVTGSRGGWLIELETNVTHEGL